MQNRDDAIHWLTEQGYLAFARDSALGESIGIARETVEGPEGLRIFTPTLVWVYPDKRGGWLVQPPLVPSPELSFAFLNEAIARAIEIVDGWESATAAGPRHVDALCGILRPA